MSDSGYGRFAKNQEGVSSSHTRGLESAFQPKSAYRREITSAATNETLDIDVLETDVFVNADDASAVEDMLINMTDGDIDDELGIERSDFKKREKEKFSYDGSDDYPEELSTPEARGGVADVEDDLEDIDHALAEIDQYL